MKLKELRGILLSIFMLVLNVGFVESLKIECEVEMESPYCWDSESGPIIECVDCRFLNVNLLQNDGPIEITSNDTLQNSKIERVIFDEGYMDYLPMTELLISFPNVKQIIFTMTNITEFSKEMLGNINQLESFEFNAFKLKILSGSFESATNLQNLVMARNEITDLPSHVFHGLNNLLALSLQDNHLRTIHSAWFDEMHKLKELHLNDNEISNLEDNVFADLTSLQILNLENNKIEIIYKGLFDHNVNLESIILNNNQISHIQAGTFLHLDNLERLCLQINECIDENFEKVSVDYIENRLENCQIEPTTTETPDEDDCRIPNIPNGFIESSDEAKTKTVEKPGTYYSSFDPVKVKCNKSYHAMLKAETDNIIFCKSGKWNKPWPVCARLCPKSALEGETITVHCTKGETTVSCHDGELFPGTIAKFQCNIGYRMPTYYFIYETLTCKENGEWDHKAPRCDAQCGVLTPKVVLSRMSHGEITYINEFPWHVGIYRDGANICGGSIIGERIVVSAAHCFCDEKEQDAIKLNKKNFKVAAGKFYRELNADEDFIAQIRDVDKIIMDERYNGKSGLLIADIALVIVKKNFEYTGYISPICTEFFQHTPQKYPATGINGSVTGWGRTEKENYNVHLLKVNLPVADFKTCVEEAPQDFKNYILGDKICVGFADPHSKIGVCSGDSGGGFVIPKNIGGQNVYHLHGIVSNGRNVDNNCDFSFYTLFTNIQEYKTLIQNAQANFPPIKI